MNSKISNIMNMNERDLEKLCKAELIKMLLKQKKSKKVRNHEDCSTTMHLRTRFHNQFPPVKKKRDHATDHASDHCP